MSNKLVNIKISSPGKVILHGEHSVVYKKPALAAVVGLRTSLHLVESEAAFFRFTFDNLNWVLSIGLESLNNFLYSHSITDEAVLLPKVQKFVSESLEIADEIQQKTAVSVCFLLFYAALHADEKRLHKGYNLTISSNLKIGAGLGSSASFGVCLTTAFMIITGHIPAAERTLTDEQLARISAWAFNSEKVMHGNPSGVDNTICTYGGIVRFIKGETFQQVTCGGEVKILLVDTNVNRSTAKLVKGVADLRAKYPSLVDSLLHAMEEVVHEAIPLYESADSDGKFRSLQQLFEINNKLLEAIGVSHASLEQIYRISKKNGFSSKLTGAGGGGYAIVLLPNDYQDRAEFKELCRELIEAGFSLTETTAGGHGVQIDSGDEM